MTGLCTSLYAQRNDSFTDPAFQEDPKNRERMVIEEPFVPPHERLMARLRGELEAQGVQEEPRHQGTREEAGPKGHHRDLHHDLRVPEMSQPSRHPSSQLSWNTQTSISSGDSVVEAWVIRYNGLGSSDDFATALAVDGGGIVYVTGYSWSGTSYDYATIKYDASGVEEWVARYNGLGNSADEAHALAVDESGNVYVTGRSLGSGTSNDYTTIKYDASGMEQWVARYNGPGNGSDQAWAIAVDSSRNVYVTG